MDITIGMQQVKRELVIEVDTTAAEFTEKVKAALTGGQTLTVESAQGRTYLLNPTLIAYIEFGRDGGRRVGFA